MKTLYRSSQDRMLCGVCAGLARYLNTDPMLVRLLWAGLALALPSLVLLYLAAAAVMPPEPV